MLFADLCSSQQFLIFKSNESFAGFIEVKGIVLINNFLCFESSIEDDASDTLFEIYYCRCRLPFFSTHQK